MANPNYQILSSHRDAVIMQYVDGSTFHEIAERFHCCSETVRRLLKRECIPVNLPNVHNKANARKYTCDFTFFDSIDTQEKAYVLGLLYSDGTNLGFRFSLAMTDKHIVEDFARVMQSNGLVSTVKKGRNKDQYYHNVFSRHMCEELTTKGCFQNKSLNLRFPDETVVPADLQRHFCRGFFDGDGSVYYQTVRKKYQYLMVSMTANFEFLEGMRDIIPLRVSLKPRKNGKIPDLKFCSRKAMQWLCDWMYTDSTISLNRKRLMFINEGLLVVS